MSNKYKSVMVIGTGGIGQVYIAQNRRSGYNVVTVDTNENLDVDFHSLEEAIAAHPTVDLAVICTPAFTHKGIAAMLVDCAKNILVEKPGFRTAKEWEEFPSKNIFMVHNNMYRRQLRSFKYMISSCGVKEIYIQWHNEERIPHPGNWFTNKELAFGGVSRDLIPHLLHMAYVLTGCKTADDLEFHSSFVEQNYTLDKNHESRRLIKHTNYGEVVPNGVYDVDDYAKVDVIAHGIPVSIEASWDHPWICKDLGSEPRDITILFTDGTTAAFDFGLCPDVCYQEMCKTIIENGVVKTNRSLDIKIHEILELITNES